MRFYKKYILFAVVSAIVASFSPAVYSEKNDTAIEIHVSTDGSDFGEGTLNSPYKTLSRAKEKVRALRKTMKKGEENPINVIFHEGVYRFSESVNFTEEDSGAEGAPVTYMGAPNEKVEFKGSTELGLGGLKKVSDKSILERLPEASRDCVGYIDLKENGITYLRPIQYGLGKHQISPDKNINYDQYIYYVNPNMQGEDYSLFLNGREQTVSQWPNGHANYSKFTAVLAGERWETGKGGVIKCEDLRAKNWVTAKDAYAAGNFSYNYFFERIPIASFAKNGEITFARGSFSGIKSTHARHYKVMNILEEMDMPGEFYIDRENLILYWYPPYGLKNATLELSILRDDMIRIRGTDYINFENITFSQTCGNAINASGVADYINIDNCDFRNIGVSAVFMIGTERTPLKVSQEYAWVEGESAGNFWSVTNCTFFNTGDTALVMTGGSPTYLHRGGPVIKNNYCNNCAAKNMYRRGFADLTGTAYFVLENNVSHNSPQGSVFYRGSKNEIRYNEFANDLRESTDAGSVYTGRNNTCRGNVISYNFFHSPDPKTEDFMKQIHNRSIYWDDAIGGQTAHHNIIFSSEDKALSSNGLNNKIYENTIVNCKNGISVGTVWDQESFTGAKNMSIIDNNMSIIGNMLKVFPELNDEYKCGAETWYQDVYNNLNVNSGMDVTDVVKKRGRVENNISVEGYDMFSDAQNYDFRLKSNSEYKDQIPGILSEDNFDINKIGICFNDKITKEELSNGEFRKLYPQNGASNITSEKLEFHWEEAYGADKYRFVLAKDKDFKDIVADTETWYPFYTVDNLDTGNTAYYWEVYAINDTRQLTNTWKSTGQKYRFTSESVKSLDITPIEQIILDLKEIEPNIVEGDIAGTYPVGTIDKITNVKKELRAALEWKKGTKTMDDVNSLIYKVNDIVSVKNVKKGFYNLDRIIAPEYWYSENPDMTVFSDNQITFKSIWNYRGNRLPENGIKKNAFVSNMGFERYSANVLLCMQIKPEYNGAWFGLGTRSPDKVQYMYSSNTYSYFLVFKEKTVEFQKAAEGTNKVLKTFDNDYLSANEWHDVVFGAIDCEFGQLIILYVDGNKVLEYLDWAADQIKGTGGLKMVLSVPIEDGYDTAQVAVRGMETLPDNYDKVINDGIRTGFIGICNEIEKHTQKSVIMKADSNVYYKDGEIHKLNSDKEGFKAVGNKMMLSEYAANEMFGFNVMKDGEKTILSCGGNSVVFDMKTGGCTIGDEPVQLALQAMTDEKGVQYYPVEAVGKVMGLKEITYLRQTALSVSDNFLPENNPDIWGALSSAFNAVEEIYN